jgi:hypothetical protein
VVELDVDTAFEQHRWRHPCRFVRVRRDLTAGDLTAKTWLTDARSSLPTR